jgi:hypothetical protein
LAHLTGVIWREFDGPHLSGVRECSVRNFDTDGVERLAASTHMTNVAKFEISPATGGHLRFFPRKWFQRLESLSVVLREEEDASALAEQPLANLVSLSVKLTNSSIVPDDRLRRLAASPNLAGVRDLRVIASAHAEDLRPIVETPTWHGLRRLTMVTGFDTNRVRATTHGVDLPELEELRFKAQQFTRADLEDFRRQRNSWRVVIPHQWFDSDSVRVLAESPLSKQLRRLQAPFDGKAGDEIIALARALITTRLEMFSIETNGVDWRWKQAVRKLLGPRVRMIRADVAEPGF